MLKTKAKIQNKVKKQTNKQINFIKQGNWIKEHRENLNISHICHSKKKKIIKRRGKKG